MRYTQKYDIPWLNYATWYNTLNENKKKELNDDLTNALKIGATSFTNYKAGQQKEAAKQELLDLYKQAGIVDENGNWNNEVDEDTLKKLLAIRTFGSLRGF